MSLRGKHVLITCGPTWVAIDPMRIMTNRSTGRIGQILAVRLQKAGARVTLLEGPVAQPLTAKKILVRHFRFFDELAGLLRAELPGRYDVIIHAAAVADYRPARQASQKIRSGQPALTWRLTPTRKLINDIRQKAPASFLVGFKWESSREQKTLVAKASQLMQKAGCDLVVANTTQGEGYTGYIVTPDRVVLEKGRSREEISKKLIGLLKDLL